MNTSGIKNGQNGGNTVRAKYIGKCEDRYNKYAVHLFYEYRGREYMITDGHNGYSETLAEQHRREQERIDRELDMELAETTEETDETNDAEIGFDLFWKMVNE